MQDSFIVALLGGMTLGVGFALAARRVWPVRRHDAPEAAPASSNASAIRSARVPSPLNQAVQDSERRMPQQDEELTERNTELVKQQQVMRSLLQDLRESKERLEEQSRSLATANAKLKELSGIKDEFVAKVNHELRTPLTAIKESIGLLLDGSLGTINPEQQEFLKLVDTSLDRLTELITHMLDLSKIEAGRLRLMRARLDVRRLIHTTVTTYQPLAGSRTVNLELAPVPEVFADANRILQVLGNLFANAIKFTNETGVITCRAQVQGGHVAVSIADNGLGIALEDRDKLFHKFSQLGDGEQAGGTGLGLALCKELVQLHGGAISVESEVGRGTTFTFTVPVYSSRLALEESFRELVDFASRLQQETVGVLLLDAEPFLGRLPQAQIEQRTWHLEQVLQMVRKHVHHGDVVLAAEPNWIAVLALTDAAGTQAMVTRLRSALHEWAQGLVGGPGSVPVHLTGVVYPFDGRDIETLLEKAKAVLTARASAAVGELDAH